METGRFVWPGGEIVTTEAHQGVILSTCVHPSGDSVVTGGDDGDVRRTDAAGANAFISHFPGEWVNHLAASSSGVLVAAIGGRVVAWLDDTPEPSHAFEFSSTVGGVALDRRGERLGVSHYDGASLLNPRLPDSGRFALQRAGSHLRCTLHPKGDYLITALQENGLHGWKIPVGGDLWMSGYRSKTRSLSWSSGARWLATSEDTDAILWPFEGPTGPINKPPRLIKGREGAIVAQVAYHPSDDLLALGFDDGDVLLVRTETGEAVKVEDAGAGITALAWNAAGTRLAYGGEDGRVGLLDW